MPPRDTTPKGHTVDGYKAAILEHGSLKAAAKALGVQRGSIQRMIKRHDGKPYSEAPPSRWRPGAEIVAARKAEFARVKTSDRGKGARIVHLADDGPYCVIFLGDPHLDSPGTDLSLWEHWIAPLNYRKHVHGFGLGDWLDNWVKPLAFLYGQSETPAPEGWILLEHYLDQIGEHLVGSVAGNHDDWSGASDVLGALMNKHGVAHASNSIGISLRCPNGRLITIGARHSWAGRSMWNPVHGIRRAAMMGRRETILVGGHTHVSAESRVKHPDAETFTWCAQVASFKTVDDYADRLDLDDKHASPAVAAVIDPRRPDTDPQLVTLFHDPSAATDYLAFLRRKKAA